MLGKWLVEQIFKEQTEIKNIVAIYPGRFQPMGKHHAQTYKWLKSKFSDAHVVTSNKVDLPKSPFSFNEKKKIIKSYGITNIVQVKNPYKAEELLKKYDPKTTAAVFMVGKKDAQRLGGKFFRPWKGKAEVGYRDGAYTIIAPHVSLKVPGYGEMSGTAIRQSLGAPMADAERASLFKHIFGSMKNYKLITNKLSISENILKFIGMGKVENIIKESTSTLNSGADVDDGPQTFYTSQNHYKKSTKDIAEYFGFEVLNYLSGDSEFLVKKSRRYTDTKSPSYFPAGVPGVDTKTNTEDNPSRRAFSKWSADAKAMAKLIGFEFLDFLGAEKSAKGITPSGEVIDEPIKVEENITVPIKVGDTVLGGKFKNKKIVVKSISKNEKGDILINGRPLLKFRLVNEGLLTEGGAYGHMSHPFDDKGLTFGDFKNMINISLQGNLNVEQSATEKTDGQNLFITWNNGLRAARNNGDIKRGGMDAKAYAAKWKGRGNIEKAFVSAFKDLEKAISKLSEKQRTKIFGDGNNYMNMEIIYPATTNVIYYDAPRIQFHGVLKYDKGAPVGTVNDGARILAGMIKQVDANIQKNFKIIGPHILKLKKHQDFGEKIPYFVGKLNILMSKYNMKDTDSFGKYHQAWWEDFVDKKFGMVDNTIKMGLVKRWAFFDKSFRLDKKNIADEKLLAKAKEFDKIKHADQVKKNMLPFELLFFELGVEVLKNVENFLAANPDKAVQHVKKQVSKAISDVRRGGDLKKLNRLGQQLSKLNKLGGWKAIVPSEGLVFVYKGKTYKLTGAFGPINQIAGMMTF